LSYHLMCEFIILDNQLVSYWFCDKLYDGHFNIKISLVPNDETYYVGSSTKILARDKYGLYGYWYKNNFHIWPDNETEQMVMDSFKNFLMDYYVCWKKLI
jgi:hypothetical protein